MNIKITADSTCDLSKELVEKYDISIVPLYIIKDGKEYTLQVKDLCSQARHAGIDYERNNVSFGR